MNLKYQYSAIALTFIFVFIFLPACTEESADRSISHEETYTIQYVERTESSGWIELLLSEAVPDFIDTGNKTAWLYFEGAGMLCFSADESMWYSYSINNISNVVDFIVFNDVPIAVTPTHFITFDLEDDNYYETTFPGDFRALSFGVGDGDFVVLGSEGEIALHDEGAFEISVPDEVLSPEGSITACGPDWVFPLDDGRFALVDPSVNLWRFIEIPFEESQIFSLNETVYVSSLDSIFVMSFTSEGYVQWDYHCDGLLYSSGIVLSEVGLKAIEDPTVVLAERPSITPYHICSMGDYNEPLWAMDDAGVIVYAQRGAIEASPPDYETHQVSRALAGQQIVPEDSVAVATVEDMIFAASGAFRIYESVSTRPDPFTEFDISGRDIRREIEDVSIEELRLVGVTLDPIGGDLAMTQDGAGVSYILYEGTELANNSRVAEITSNEVIIIQDVIVDYGPASGGETTIPTIYSMRLYEEGGL